MNVSREEKFVYESKHKEEKEKEVAKEFPDNTIDARFAPPARLYQGNLSGRAE